MKFLKSGIPLIAFLSVFLFSACGEEEELPPLTNLAGTIWVSFNNESVLSFQDTSWTREVEGVARIFQGTYDYSNPPLIIFSRLDEDGNVELTFEGEVVDENNLSFREDHYIRR